MGVGSEGQRRPPTHFSSPLDSWGPRVAAAGPGLHQSDGGGVWLHAPGFFSPPSGPSALQGPGVRAAQEVSQPGEALGRTSSAPSPAPGGTAREGAGRAQPPPFGHLETQSRLPVSQHVRSLLANQPSAPRRGASPHPPLQQLLAGRRCPALTLRLCPHLSLILCLEFLSQLLCGSRLLLFFRSPPPRTCLTPIPDPDPLRFHSCIFPTLFLLLCKVQSGPRASLEAPGGQSHVLFSLARQVLHKYLTNRRHQLCARPCAVVGSVESVPSETKLHPPSTSGVPSPAVRQLPADAWVARPDLRTKRHGEASFRTSFPTWRASRAMGPKEKEDRKESVPAQPRALYFGPRPLGVSATPHSLFP